MCFANKLQHTVAAPHAPGGAPGGGGAHVPLSGAGRAARQRCRLGCWLRQPNSANAAGRLPVGGAAGGWTAFAVSREMSPNEDQ